MKYNQIKQISITLIKNNRKINTNINYSLENLNNYQHIINKYKRDDIIWPLPNGIKFKPWMNEKDLPIKNKYISN